MLSKAPKSAGSLTFKTLVETLGYASLAASASAAAKIDAAGL